MKTFNEWMEAVVTTKSINNAIRESIEFIVGGKWETKTNTFKPFKKETGHGPVGSTKEYQRCHIQMLGEVEGYNGNNLFWLQAWSDVYNDVQNYDSKIGDPSVTIEADLYGRYDTDKKNVGNFKKIGVERFSTPLQLAKWAKTQIDNFKEDDDDGPSEYEDEPVDPSLEPELVPVGSRRN